MTMRTKHAARPGFTLIELLTVIAIIAILAALIFPVFGQVREQTRQTSCMSQMHSLWVALKQYHEDNNRYPSALLGFVESGNGNFYTPSDTTKTSIDQLVFKPLFKGQKYLNDKSLYVCPDSPHHDPLEIALAYYPNNIGAGLKGQAVLWDEYLQHYANKDNDPYFQANNLGRPVYFYAYDSYDVGPALSLDNNGNVVKPSPTAPLELHYSVDWTGVTGRNDRTPAGKLASNQLKYNDAAPPDSTVVTWCTYHAIVNGSSNVPVIFLSGRVKTVPVKEFVKRGPLGFTN